MSRKDLLRFLSKPANCLWLSLLTDVCLPDLDNIPKISLSIQQTSSSARPDTFTGIGICQVEGHRHLITIPALKAFYFPLSARPP
ncbi:hypothetical protein MGYG_04247 [Nannizzia gypsea CBS 118893]|uniref:Uncharacterized protein n=1 Tax=Arthroderma gypseum (strain ATCC MYA-4604 / CBS 118893) TaxID=535722 RepID=E4URY6_ARTGP|nr:hypothetical protein MGYG_04247 [Nannizzia gypsea CBS 118893]EFR01243.1 hypothetical protein MGYG_04247 [Nannizzia gypsea CBS 118893]